MWMSRASPAQSQPSALIKCHACHTKRRWMSPSGTRATQNAGGCRQVPGLPRKTKVYVTKCHACQVKRRHMSPSATPATQSAAASPATNPVQARHQSQPSALSTTPATQNEGGCRQVPHLPRKVPWRHWRLIPSVPPKPAQCPKHHACHCHAKPRWMSPSATPATQSAPASLATNPVQAPPEPAQCPKCHACHAKRRWMSPSATPATQSAAVSPETNPVQARHQSQPSALSTTPATQSAAASPATNPVQAHHQSQPSALSAKPAMQNEGGCRQVPGLPRKTKVYVYVTKWHACQVKRRHMSPSATPATQSAAASPATIRSERVTRASPVP